MTVPFSTIPSSPEQVEGAMILAKAMKAVKDNKALLKYGEEMFKRHQKILNPKTAIPKTVPKKTIASFLAQNIPAAIGYASVVGTGALAGANIYKASKDTNLAQEKQLTGQFNRQTTNRQAIERLRQMPKQSPKRQQLRDRLISINQL